MWQLEVEESFHLTGRGVVAVGHLEGVVQAGEPAVVCVGEERQVIEAVWPEFGSRNGRSALLLRGVGKDQVPAGALVRSTG